MKVTEVTSLLKPSIFFFRSPVTKSQTLTTLSAPLLARVRPSRFQLTPKTWCRCPSKVLITLPLGRSVTFTNLSAAPEARYLPSDEKSSARTVSLCALLNSRSILPSAMFQRMISPLRLGSPPPVASHLPSRLKRTALTRSTNGESGPPVPIVRSSVQGGFKSQTTRAPSKEVEISLLVASKASAICAKEPGALVRESGAASV